MPGTPKGAVFPDTVRIVPEWVGEGGLSWLNRGNGVWVGQKPSVAWILWGRRAIGDAGGPKTMGQAGVDPSLLVWRLWRWASARQAHAFFVGQYLTNVA